MHRTGCGIVDEGDRHLGPGLGDLTHFNHPPVIPVRKHGQGHAQPDYDNTHGNDENGQGRSKSETV